eukprot:m.235919 g.235919  ORF g.235919 m.235919 type:complete len:470 (+) comp15767_c0_seq1:109-1518(+)
MPRRPPGQAGPATAVAAEEFHRLRVKLLPPADAEFLLRALQDYATMRKPDRLVQALKPIIDTVPKRAVVEQLCESLVPPAHRSIILAAFPPSSTAASPHAPITLNVNLHRMGGSSGGLGLSLRGGSEYGLGLFVSAVVDGSPADLGGLQRGDRLVSIEGRNTEGMSHAGAVELLVAAGEVVGLEIERGGEAIPTGDRFRLASAWRHKDAEQSRAQEKRKFTRREVVLNRPPGGSQPLGMGLRGGAETGLTGIFVSAVSGGGTAAEAGIRPGDRLVAINGNVLGPDCSLNTAIAALVSAVGAVSLSIEPAAVPPRRRPAPSETRPAPSSAPSPAPSSATASPAASPAVMPVGAVFEEIAFGGVMRRGRTARKDDSIRASTYLDDEGGAISTVRSVDSPGAESRGGGGAFSPSRQLPSTVLRFPHVFPEFDMPHCHMTTSDLRQKLGFLCYLTISFLLASLSPSRCEHSAN